MNHERRLDERWRYDGIHGILRRMYRRFGHATYQRLAYWREEINEGRVPYTAPNIAEMDESTSPQYWAQQGESTSPMPQQLETDFASAHFFSILFILSYCRFFRMTFMYVLDILLDRQAYLLKDMTTSTRINAFLRSRVVSSRMVACP